METFINGLFEGKTILKRTICKANINKVGQLSEKRF